MKKHLAKVLRAVQTTGAKFCLALAGALGLSAVTASPSQAVAALPAGAALAITQIGETATLFETAVWPVILIISVAMICIKLYKRFSNKL